MNMKIIGNHRVTCLPVEKLDFNKLIGNKKIDILYSDPPWDDGNLKFWCTINKKMTGKTYSPINYQSLITIFINIIKQYVRGYVFIECGVKLHNLLLEKMKEVLYNIKIYDTIYSSQNRPNKLLFGGTSKQFNFNINVNGMKGYSLPLTCIKSCKGQYVLDPCCGLGYTARACIDTGKTFIGNEFNSKRLSKTIAILENYKNSEDTERI